MDERYASQTSSSRLDYAEDWSDFLISGDIIQSSDWTADSPEITLTSPSIASPLTIIWASGGVSGKTYRLTNVIETRDGRRDSRSFWLAIRDDVAQAQDSALFDRFAAVAEFRRDTLAALGGYQVESLSGDAIWQSLCAAEAEASRALRVFFRPTTVIPEDAPQSEIDALIAAGTPFVQESPYDYDPHGWTMDAWGYIIAKNSPIIRVDSARFTYPNPGSDVLNVPLEWLRLDKQHGHIRFVPTGAMMALGPMSTYMMSAIGSGRIIPNMFHLRYVAGLENAARDYPDLIKVVKRMAALAILKNAFLPQSGSISADGLSQSSSVDTSKWQESIDHDMDALRDSIHGVRMVVL